MLTPLTCTFAIAPSHKPLPYSPFLALGYIIVVRVWATVEHSEAVNADVGMLRQYVPLSMVPMAKELLESKIREKYKEPVAADHYQQNIKPLNFTTAEANQLGLGGISSVNNAEERKNAKQKTVRAHLHDFYVPLVRIDE